MKKKFDLDKFKKIYVDAMKPTYEGWLFFATLFCTCLLYDLEQWFNLSIGLLHAFCSWVCIALGMYELCWCVCSFIYAILNKRRQKKEGVEDENK